MRKMKGFVMKKILAVILASMTLTGGIYTIAIAADNSQPHYSTIKAMSPEEAATSRASNIYLNYLGYCLRLNWKNPVSNNYQAGFSVNIDKAGKITGYDTIVASKSAEFEKAALQTILKTAPFKPLPAELKMGSFNTEIYFNGQDIQANGIYASKHLKNKVSQNNKVCRTIEIEEAKQIAMQSEYPQYVSNAVHLDISNQIQQNWRPYLKTNNAVAVSFKIAADGTMQNIKLNANQTQNPDAADASVEAVKSVKLSKVPDSSIGANIVYYFAVGENLGF